MSDIKNYVSYDNAGLVSGIDRRRGEATLRFSENGNKLIEVSHFNGYRNGYSIDNRIKQLREELAVLKSLCRK